MPVASRSLIDSAGRARTLPFTCSTVSLRRCSATAKASGLKSGSTVICTVPLRSRRSMKITPPWSRRRSTQPQSCTSWPVASWRRSPHPWLRIGDVPAKRDFPTGGRRPVPSPGWRGATQPRGRASAAPLAPESGQVKRSRGTCSTWRRQVAASGRPIERPLHHHSRLGLAADLHRQLGADPGGVAGHVGQGDRFTQRW